MKGLRIFQADAINKHYQPGGFGADKTIVFPDIDNWTAVLVENDGMDSSGNPLSPLSHWIYDSNGKYMAFLNRLGILSVMEYTSTGKYSRNYLRFNTKYIERRFDPVTDLKQAIRYVYLMLQEPK